MLDKDLMERKLRLILGFIDELAPLVEQFSVEEVMADNYKYHTAERLLQLIVDTMVDVNVHLIKEKALVVPDDLQSTFTELGKQGLLPEEFALHIAPVVGLRNRIVHRYDTLNMKDFLEKLKVNFPDFKTYLTHISQVLANE